MELNGIKEFLYFFASYLIAAKDSVKVPFQM